MATRVEPGSGRPATDSGLASTSEAAEVPKRRASSRTRLIGARALTVVAILLALVGMLAYYVAHTALDDSGFETIARNMIENDAIRTQVAITAVLVLGLIAPLFARDWTSTLVMLALIVVGVEVVRHIVRGEVTPQTGSG